MFIMAYGAMLSYLMIVKDTFSAVLGVPPDDLATRRAILFVISTVIMVPLSSQRDVADLAKTSRVSVTFDLILVLIVVYLSDLPEAWKSFDWRSSIIHVETIFVGLGVLSFVFVCQHSAFIIAGSLDRPTKVRWATVTRTALIFAACLALTMGVGGFVGFQDRTQGSILSNLPVDSRLAKVAKALLGTTMLFVYPMESFVARHVCVVLLFQGRHAHEGDDSTVLSRRDRRITLTVALYLVALVPAAIFENLGSVLAATGAGKHSISCSLQYGRVAFGDHVARTMYLMFLFPTPLVGGSCLSYIGPGIVYIGVHGGRFIQLSDAFFGRRTGFLGSLEERPEEFQQQEEEVEYTPLYCDRVQSSVAVHSTTTDSWFTRQFKNLLWYIFGMPLWYPLARAGKQYFTTHVTEVALKSRHPIRIGSVRFARAKLRSGDTRVVMLSNKGESSRNFDVDTELLRADSLSRSYDTQRMANGKIVALPPIAATIKQKSFLATTNDTDKGIYQSINQKIGAMAKRQKEEEELALEDDPQQDPPEVWDFLIALFYIVFGVVAMCAGLFSIFV
jgi:sodium-coupled neutral amino acid transporter 11